MTMQKSFNPGALERGGIKVPRQQLLHLKTENCLCLLFCFRKLPMFTFLFQKTAYVYSSVLEKRLLKKRPLKFMKTFYFELLPSQT